MFELVTPEDDILDISTFEAHAIYPATHLFRHVAPSIDSENLISMDYDYHGSFLSTSAGVFLSPPIDLSDYHYFEVLDVNLPLREGNYYRDGISLIVHPDFSVDTYQDLRVNGYSFLASAPVQYYDYNADYNGEGGHFDSFRLDVGRLNGVARVGFALTRWWPGLESGWEEHPYTYGIQVGGMKMISMVQGWRTVLSSVGGKMVNSKMVSERRRVF